MAIIIPDRLKLKLLENNTWLSNIANIMQNTENYFARTPYFFPEYTHHGIYHVNKVLELCDKLITNDTLEKLSCRDVGILIIGAITHDIGMFIEKDGLQRLLLGSGKDHKKDGLDSFTWNEEWNKYLIKARRFSDAETYKIFGKAQQVKIPSADMSDLCEEDRLVYGDFLRQQHHRLGHYIICNGFLGTITVDILNRVDVDDQIKDIIGLIARSHGINLRDAYQYLSSNFGSISMPKNIPVFYLMSVLRMADYLDAGKKRSPKELFDLQTPISPMSRYEWFWNMSIDSDDYNFDEAHEYLDITADPSESKQFVKVEAWLKDCQSELDLCWAVLGEHYGRERGYSMTIRRINSNILIEESRRLYENKYLPRKVSIEVNRDIIKLLINPLYDGNPTFGVRELIQNAVDACRERKFSEQEKGSLYEGAISVTVDTKNKIFSIIDNGIGMTSDIIISYFLTAGASFRNSDAWNDAFLENEKAVLPRIGKFGIGFMSAYLLGKNISVKTRNINEDLGYEFRIAENEDIDVIRVSCEIGTEISIQISDTVTEYFLDDYPKKGVAWWNWYHFSSPKITYTKNGVKTPIFPDALVPDEQDYFPKWFSLNSTNFKSFKWTYSNGLYLGKPDCCNGIQIHELQHRIGENYGFIMPTPIISIVDYDDKVNFNLSRTKLIEFPEEGQLSVEIYKYFIAQLLTYGKETKRERSGVANEFRFLSYQSKFNFSPYDYSEKVIISKEGFTLLSYPFMKCLKNLDNLRIFEANYSDNMKDLNGSLVDEVPYISFQHNESHYALDVDIHYELPFEYNYLEVWLDYDGEFNDASKSFVDTCKLPIIEGKEGWYYPSSCRILKMLRQNTALKEQLSSAFEIQITNLKCDIEDKDNIMFQLLQKYLGEDAWIPFNYEERKKKFPLAFNELKIYMK